MEKLPPIEKIYEAYSVLADDRINIEGNVAHVRSSNGTRKYRVEWERNIYSSTDNGTYWQGYPGYPIVAVLLHEKKIMFDESVITYFSEIDWNDLNIKYKRNYRAAVWEIFKQKKLSDKQIEKVENVTQHIFEQLQRMNIKVVRKIKR